MTRIALVDDHDLVRGAFRSLLAQEPDLEIVAELGSGDELEKLEAAGPDVVVLDLMMPGPLSGREVALKLRGTCPSIKILIVSQQIESVVMQHLLRHGVTGFLSKRSALDEFARAIRAVAAGQFYFCPECSAALATTVGVVGDCPLSARELEILARTARGATVREIAEALYLSPKTVEKHRGSILRKLESRNILEALQRAREQKLISD
ncbi:MAG: DNA-binding response regulator [Candidatus Xenobia bacterium]|jgi:DNA-binding NarL/FixJ family response regulator